MTIKILEALSNADAIASNEKEVQTILYHELKPFCDHVVFDRLGSIMFEKKGTSKGPKIMLCAHMDEIGFMVKAITPNGHVMVMPIGGVKPHAQMMQKVRITTENGKKYIGILNAKFQDQQALDPYVDLGLDSAEQVYALGISVGDMVTFDTTFEMLSEKDLIVGKAFDDRIGCYILGEVLKRLQHLQHENDVVIAMTSSEEVGVRGARTASYTADADIAFPIDVACYQDEFIKDYRNQRQIGKGVMQTNYDSSLIPNRYLMQYMRKIAYKHNIPLQLDMFTRGATDGKETHVMKSGCPTVVGCIPVRYGHCGYSIAHVQDIEYAIDLYTRMICNFTQEDYQKSIDFLGGNI